MSPRDHSDLGRRDSGDARGVVVRCKSRPRKEDLILTIRVQYNSYLVAQSHPAPRSEARWACE